MGYVFFEIKRGVHILVDHFRKGLRPTPVILLLGSICDNLFVLDWMM